MQHTQPTPEGTPEGAKAAGRGYWFAPVPVYLLDAVYDPDSPVNAPALVLWAHIHRHYAWRERIFPSCARLAEETGLSERTIARLLQALRSAGALTWGAGFSSKGRSSNQYALAPFKPFQFDREPPPSVAAKNGSHSGEPVKDGSHFPDKGVSHHPDKNGRGIKSSSYLESTEEPLSPSAPTRQAESTPVADERENPSSFEDPQQTNPLPGVDVYTAQLADADAVTRVTTSWTEAYKRSSSGSEPSARAVSRVRASATSRLRAGKTADDLVLIAADMAETNLAWTDLAEHEAHWLHKQHGGLTGTDAAVLSVTDQRVQQALDLGRQMQAEADARNGGGYEAAQTYMNQQAAIGARPYGWEQVPHCGHLDCDEITRYRETEDANGLRSLSACPDCHPSLRF